MLRAKEGRQKAKGAALPVVPILQKFLRTYEKHCAQTRTSVCPAVKRDLKAGIDNGQILRKVSLWSPLFIPLWNGVGFTPDDHGSSIFPSPEVVVSPPLHSCLTEAQSLACWHFHTSPLPQAFPRACLSSHHFTSGTANRPLLPCYIWKVQLKSTTFSSLRDLPPQHCSHGPDPSMWLSPSPDCWLARVIRSDLSSPPPPVSLRVRSADT